jgi:hypothetical protein
MPNVSRLSIFKPRSTRVTFIRLRVNRPAATSSAIDSAICAVASDVLNRAAARAPEGWPDWPFMMLWRSGRLLCSAGKIPKSRPVAMVTAAAKSRTVVSSRTGIVAAGSGGNMAAMPRSVQLATTRPAIPPKSASKTDSVRSCAMSLHRLAPIDRRMAISPARAAARASSRFAMLAQAMSSTSAVTPRRSVSGALASRCTEL